MSLAKYCYQSLRKCRYESQMAVLIGLYDAMTRHTQLPAETKSS